MEAEKSNKTQFQQTIDTDSVYGFAYVTGHENKPLSKCKSGPPRMLAVGTSDGNTNENSLHREGM